MIKPLVDIPVEVVVLVVGVIVILSIVSGFCIYWGLPFGDEKL